MALHSENRRYSLADKRRKPSRAVLPLMLLASCGVAACMVFGNPTLWVSEAQVLAEQEAERAAAEARAHDVMLSSYEAISESDDENRAKNIAVAAEALDKTVIEPGETFSFNDALGPTDEDAHYVEAPVLYANDIITDYGGGVCQVSTALYIAAIEADMEIVERHSHSVVSDYAPIGLDATVAYGELDLKLKNNSAYPITIHAEATGQTVTVSLTGDPLPDGETIDATSRIVDRFEKEDQTGTTRLYYISEAFKVHYRDGVRQYRDLLSSDVYVVYDPDAVKLIEGSVEPNK